MCGDPRLSSTCDISVMFNLTATVSTVTLFVIVWIVIGAESHNHLELAPKRSFKSEAQLILMRVKFYPEFEYKYLPSLLQFVHGKRYIIANCNNNQNKMVLLYICVLIVMQAGDCQPNPGPGPSSGDTSEPRFPCQVCNVACLWGERAICCDECDKWYHVECMCMGPAVFEVLEQNSGVSWICCNCGVPNFSTSLFTSGSIDLMNSFSSLSSVEIEDRPPLATSSPHQNYTNTKTNLTNGDQTNRSKEGHTQDKLNLNRKGHDKGHKQEQTKTKKQSSFSRTIKCLVINFQSIQGKTAEMATCIKMDDPDIIVGTETWLKDSVNSSEIFPDHYTVYRKDRPAGAKGLAHGGVLIAVKSEIICAHKLDLDTEQCEILWIEINIAGAKPLLVGAYYRPPNSDRDYLGRVNDSPRKFNAAQYNIWLAGDFNLGDIIWESQTLKPGSQKPTLCRDLIDIANDFGLTQMVTEPTRGKNTLDLFFTSNPTLVTKSSVIPGISDHDGIPVIIANIRPTTTKQKPRKVYLFHKANSEGLKADVKGISEEFRCKDLNVTSVEDLRSELKEKVQLAVDTHIPSKIVRKRNNSPWITQNLKRLHRRKQRAYNRAKKSNKAEDWESYRHLRNKIKHATRNSYRSYVRDKCLESTKQFWTFVKSLKKDSSGIPALKSNGELIIDNKSKPEVLNKQYQSQFTIERSELPTEPDSDIPSMPDIRLYPTSSTACTLNAAPCWSVTTVKIMRPQMEQF